MDLTNDKLEQLIKYDLIKYINQGIPARTAIKHITVIDSPRFTRLVNQVLIELKEEGKL